MITVIVGPTGVGKTKLSIELAKRQNAIVINADSMQVYRDLNIGTAKVTEEEKCGIQHELFDIVDVNDLYTVYDYQKDLRNMLKKYEKRNIVIVGGTGLYIKAGLYDYQFSEEENNDNYDGYTNEELYNMALKKDKDMDIHINNRKRLVRFLNKKDINAEKNKDKLLYDAKFIGLTTSRDILYERINKRVDIMIESGLIDEVKKFYDAGVRSKAIMTGIGYKELYEYFDNLVTLDEAIDNIKRNSRKYAKRQYTWFNNQMDIKWFDVNFDNFFETMDEVIDYLDN